MSWSRNSTGSPTSATTDRSVHALWRWNRDRGLGDRARRRRQGAAIGRAAERRNGDVVAPIRQDHPSPRQPVHGGGHGVRRRPARSRLLGIWRDEGGRSHFRRVSLQGGRAGHGARRPRSGCGKDVSAGGKCDRQRLPRIARSRHGGGCNPADTDEDHCPRKFGFTQADRIKASDAVYRAMQSIAYENLVPLAYTTSNLRSSANRRRTLVSSTGASSVIRSPAFLDGAGYRCSRCSIRAGRTTPTGSSSWLDRRMRGPG
jgi:hypothetical protein